MWPCEDLTVPPPWSPGGQGRRRRGPASGFTLIELLVVLVLIGVASSLIFLSVGSGLLQSEETRFLHSFEQTLVHARSASLGRGEAVRFLIDGENRTFSMEGGKILGIPESVQVEGSGIAEVNPGVYGVIFYPDGSSSGGEIDLQRGDGGIDRIRVDKLLGLIRIEREVS